MLHRLFGLALLLIGLLVIPLSHLAISSPPTEAGAKMPKPGTALYHARQCEKHLGPLPKFTCDDALDIPITQDGKQVAVTASTRGKILKHCDKPAAFGAGCQVGNRVGRYQGTHASGDPRPEVIFMTFCRDGGMGVIGHNSKTGATCFFSIEDGAPAFGDVAGPNDPGYEQGWQTPEVVGKDGCVKCHMADPFLHTPWIDQVRNPENPSEPFVPLIADESSPYFVVGDGFPQPPGRDVAPLKDNKCTECHRAQCIPKFFNVRLDELQMPAPFDEIHKETDSEMIADREALRKWCQTLNIKYFGKTD